MRILREGLNGPDVTAWQTFLAGKHLYDGPLNGQFDHFTDRGTRAFQALSHLTADGIVGSFSQWAALMGGLIPDGETLTAGVDTNRSLKKFGPCLKGDGLRFAGRYYALAANAVKCLTRDEAKALSDQGIELIAVYEDLNNVASAFSTAIGRSQARRALDSAAKIGQPGGSAIYFACDFDPLPAHVNGVILDYFRAVKKVFDDAASPFTIGIYGSGLACKTMRDLGLAKLTWVTGSGAFNGSKAFRDQADILQILPDRLLSCGAAGDVDIDADIARGTAFGSFRI